MIEFLERYKDVIDIFLGLTTGILLSILGFLITHRFNWRNFLTREFTVKLKENFRQVTGENITKLGLVFEINCTNGDELSINYTFLKLSKKVTGNTPPNPTAGEVLFGNKGRLYIQDTPAKFQYFLSGEYIITDARILRGVLEGTTKKIRLVVNSNKYGNVKSNSLRLRRIWIRRMLDKIRS